MLRRLLLTVMAAGFAVMLVPGCGGGAKVPVAAKPDTSVQTGAVCDTTLDTTATASAAQPDTQKPEPVNKEASKPREPKPEPEKVAEKPKALPRMWDYGSTNCLPCMEMEKILTPLMAEYAGKVDVRIINVYENREQTQQARIQVIPTQIFYAPDGKELYRHIGVYPRDSIVAKFKEFGWE
jgi:thioredoxin 1